MKPKKKRQNPELIEHKRVAGWLETQLAYGNIIEFTSTAQETFTGWAGITINRAKGIRKGLPDIIILLKPKEEGGANRLLFIEMKHPGVTASAVKVEQLVWNKALNDMGPNVIAAICYSAEAAINLLTELIGDIHPRVDRQSFEQFLLSKPEKV